MTTVLLLIGWVGSALWNVQYGFDNASNLVIGVNGGRVDVDWRETRSYINVGWWTKMARPPWHWWFSFGNSYAAVPVWFLAVLAATPTFLIWLLDRNRDPVACLNCGYSRTGLPADRACPECGASSIIDLKR